MLSIHGRQHMIVLDGPADLVGVERAAKGFAHPMAAGPGCALGRRPLISGFSAARSAPLFPHDASRH